MLAVYCCLAVLGAPSSLGQTSEGVVPITSEPDPKIRFDNGKVRITSYNVCYTKLLRIAGTGEWIDQYGRPPQDPIAPNRRGISPNTIGQFVSVITSYSIHYTKLYDSTSARVRVDGEVRQQDHSLKEVIAVRAIELAGKHATVLETGDRNRTGRGRITSYNVCYTKLLRANEPCAETWRPTLATKQSRTAATVSCATSMALSPSISTKIPAAVNCVYIPQDGRSLTLPSTSRTAARYNVSSVVSDCRSVPSMSKMTAFTLVPPSVRRQGRAGTLRVKAHDADRRIV